MAHQALYRKWRPLTFDDVVGQEHITSALRAQVEAGRLSHAYLFTGTRGTGKTTCAKILARAACCLSPQNGNPCNHCEACLSVLDDSAMDVMEIDAASNNGVENIREIREEVNYSPAQLKMRVYIIDEVHMLSSGAFNALLKTLEEPPEHVLFILATTEIHKVPATILSRCQRYDFRRITPETIAQRLSYIAAQENLSLSPKAALLLAKLGDGSMRDAISLLDRCVAGDRPIEEKQVVECLGITEHEKILSIFQAVCRHDASAALSDFYDCYVQGRDITSLLDELLSLIRDLYIIQAVKDPQTILNSSFFTYEELKPAAALASAQDMEFYVQTLHETLSRLTRSAIRRADGEMCLLKLCRGAAAAMALAPAAASRSAAPVASAPVASAPVPAASSSVPPKETEPAAKPSPSVSGDAQLKERFFAALKGRRMNPACATYIRMGEYTAKGQQLVAWIDEEGLLFLDRPNMLTILETAAQAIGFSAIKLKAKGQPQEAETSNDLDDLLSSARQMGVEVTEKE
ncbi:DNA polymerase III subunit gamma/tau [Acidaminobacterium chupaoyuni]